MPSLNSLMEDPVLASEGVWVPFAAGVEVKIARANNPRMLAASRKLSAAAGRAIVSDRELGEELWSKAAAREIVKDWRGITDDAGNPIPYSPEKAEEFLLDPANRTFRDFVSETAGDHTLYRRVQAEAAVGNS